MFRCAQIYLHSVFAKVLTDNVVITDMEFKVTLHPKPMPPGLRAKQTDIMYLLTEWEGQTGKYLA